MTYPICESCQQSILMHRLVGVIAYCDPKVRSAETRSESFTVKDINDVRRTLGHKLSYYARDRERMERSEMIKERGYETINPQEA